MRLKLFFGLPVLLAGVLRLAVGADENGPLPGTQPLTVTGDLSAQMVAGIDRFLSRETERVAAGRAVFWKRDVSSPEAYSKSVETNRVRLRRMIGLVEATETARPTEAVLGLEVAPSDGKTERYTVTPVRWPEFEDVHGEGLLLRPVEKPVACVVAIPDADQTPEMLAGLQPGLPPESQFARCLAEQGYLVIVPVLIDRKDTHSGNPKLGRFTNQPHREWIYRQAYELGRHPIGYEVQKVLAAVDWAESRDLWSVVRGPKIGVAGYGEGGLIALYAAALQPKLSAAMVSGYFGPREGLWQEPIYRNVFGVLREFGDAEIASLIAPRRLIVEYSEAPNVEGPPAAREGHRGAAPGRITTPEQHLVENELRRANALVAGLTKAPFAELVNGAEGVPVALGSEKALLLFLAGLDVKLKKLSPAPPPPPFPITTGELAERQRRQVKELERHTQQVFRDSERTRDALVWNRVKTPGPATDALRKQHRDVFWEEVIGKLPTSGQPPSPRTRRIHDQPAWTGYEVMLDVFPDVFAWGYLLVPKDLKPGERRPVVVCQHGLEGLPEHLVTEDAKSGAFQAYQAYAARLAERGFVVYVPHNPYRGDDKFRVLQRKANPLGLSLFSFIIAQHEVTLNWLATLPFVDAERIGFYGLSYGGKTAMRVPAVLERYCLSICSGDFNEWVQKNVTVDSPYSYLFTGEYEMPEWDLGHTFNYAEMAWLIAPRPFMVERGHFDGVAPDPWVAYEYAKVRKLYDVLGLPERTEIEFFNGPHRINGVGTFQFLHEHLNWPEPK
ncbi:MAG: dienelactone hydrolase family protein [Verrucomicrobia bacterium]|nr:dienelactone hydrolase family protein [Verrucomicrobiota bacterium]